MGQNALRQSDCRIFKLDIKHEKIDELTSFLVFRYGFIQHNRWFINFNEGMVIKVFSQSRLRILNSAISAELIGKRA